jgi:hypothetical protein
MKRFVGTLTVMVGLLFGLGAEGGQFSALNLPPMTLIAAAADSSSNTYVLGTFTSALSIGDRTLVSGGGTDYVLAQYHADGTVGWAISFGTPQDEYTHYTRLNVTSDSVLVSTSTTIGSIYVVDMASNVVNTAYAGKTDAFLFRFSLAGVVQWHASITSIGDEAGSGVSSDSEGNVYWAGAFNGCCPSQGGATLTGGDGTSVALATPSYCTAFLCKMSPTGTVLWVAKAYNRDAAFWSVAVDNQGNSYVFGQATSWSFGTPTTVVNSDGSTASVSNQGTACAFLLKFDAAGISQWSASMLGTLDYNDYPNPSVLSVTSAGDVLIGESYTSGSLTLPSTDGKDLQLPPASGYDGFVAAYSSGGVAKWVVQVPGNSNQRVTAICNTGSNLWVGGLTTGAIDLPGISLAPRGAQNIFTLRMNINGQVLSGRLLGGTGTDVLTSLQVVGDSLGLVAGNEGGDFLGFGVQIPNPGPFALTGGGEPPGGPVITLLKAVKPALSGLSVGTNYQLQVSSDPWNWTNCGSPFTATNTSMVYPQYWDVDNWRRLFFRVQVAP